MKGVCFKVILFWESLLAIIDKYGGLISEWGSLYNLLLEDVYEQNSIVKNVRVDDWTAELAIIASNDKLCVKWFKKLTSAFCFKSHFNLKVPIQIWNCGVQTISIIFLVNKMYMLCRCGKHFE